MHFLLFRIFEQLCACPKNRVALEFFTVLNILLTFKSFEQLALALKNRGCPEFIVLNIRIFFIIQDFCATYACPEKQSVPWNFSLY